MLVGLSIARQGCVRPMLGFDHSSGGIGWLVGWCFLVASCLLREVPTHDYIFDAVARRRQLSYCSNHSLPSE